MDNSENMKNTETMKTMEKIQKENSELLLRNATLSIALERTLEYALLSHRIIDSGENFTLFKSASNWPDVLQRAHKVLYTEGLDEAMRNLFLHLFRTRIIAAMLLDTESDATVSLLEDEFAGYAKSQGVENSLKIDDFVKYWEKETKLT